MKFKFKTGKKDWRNFFIMLAVIAYMTLFAVGNFISAVTTQTFDEVSFFPFIALDPQYIAFTIIVFIGVVWYVFAATEKSIFEKSKGFGFKTEEKEKGNYSRWATDKEIQKTRGVSFIKASDHEFETAGVPLLTDGKKIWVDNENSHTLIVGTTGSGKTTKLVDPLITILGKAGESMLMTDPKGELYKNHSPFLKDRGYDVVVINLRNPDQGNAWNPLMLPYKFYKQGDVDKATELLDDLGVNILHDEKASSDPFWTNTSADYFVGNALGLFEDATEEQINLNSINYMTTIGEERYKGSSYIKEYYEAKDKSGTAYINVSSVINAPQDTKGSVLSVFKQKIKLFSSKENLSEMLSHSDFDMADIGKKKTAVFLVIQDEKKTYHSLATIFVKQVYESLIDVAQHTATGELPIRTNFILDEFANMPPLKDVTTMITAARSRQIRFNLIIQNFAQLTQVYGKENAETIKGNCTNLIYLLTTELAALEEISKLCGDIKNKDKDSKEGIRPLITVNELQRLKFGQSIYIKDRVPPFKSKLPFLHEYDFRKPEFDKGTFPKRTKTPVQLFNIQDYVRERDKKKLMDILNEGDSDGAAKSGKPSPMMSPSMNAGPSIPDMGDSFDVDKMIKQLDDKIAALEAEEKQDKKKQDAVVSKPAPKPIVNKPEVKVNIAPTSEKEPVSLPKEPVQLSIVDEQVEKVKPALVVPTVNVEEDKPEPIRNIDDYLNAVSDEPDKKEEAQKEVTDDQFFDDFFED